MLRVVLKATLLIGAIGFLSVVAAQEDTTCPAVLDVALRSVERECAEIGGNRACYGHRLIAADLFPGENEPAFDSPGDEIDIARLDSLRLSALNPNEGTWGIAKLRVRATTNTAQLADMNVMVFGDVTARNDAMQRVMLQGRIEPNFEQNVNLRILPDLTSFVSSSVAPGTTVDVIGRLSNERWYRVQVPGQDVFGWVPSEYLDIEGDTSTLLVEAAGDEYLGPMQAFVIDGQLNSTDLCDGVPLDGLLIQTPEGPAQVRIYVNEISVDLLPSTTGNSVLVQPGAPGSDGALTFNMLQGAAVVTANGARSNMIGGAAVSVPTNPDGTASGIPSAPAAYDYSILSQLPSEILGENVIVATPPSNDFIIANNETKTLAGELTPDTAVTTTSVIITDGGVTDEPTVVAAAPTTDTPNTGGINGETTAITATTTDVQADIPDSYGESTVRVTATAVRQSASTNMNATDTNTTDSAGGSGESDTDEGDQSTGGGSGHSTGTTDTDNEDGGNADTGGGAAQTTATARASENSSGTVTTPTTVLPEDGSTSTPTPVPTTKVIPPTSTSTPTAPPTLEVIPPTSTSTPAAVAAADDDASEANTGVSGFGLGLRRRNWVDVAVETTAAARTTSTITAATTAASSTAATAIAAIATSVAGIVTNTTAGGLITMYGIIPARTRW